MFNVLDNGRDKLGNYESIGMFVNTLPLLVDCSDKDPVSFMDDVKDLIFNVFSYNFYPFRVLAQKFNINSSILFQYQPIFDEVNGQFFNVSDFEFRMFAKNNRYVVNVIYSDVFSLDTIRRFVESYDIILNQLLSVNKLSDINYISSSDLEFLNNYNETSCELDYVDILDGFNANLSKYPDNVLVSYEDRSYTYGEGAFIANKISDRLIDLDVVRQDYVALFIGRSEWYLLASLGVLTCGAVYVPIETSYPDDRIVLMLNDTQSDIVIVDDNSEQRMNEIIADNNLNITILNVSSILDGVVGSSTCLDVVDVDEDDVACVLYTSGTTGTPKGVLVTRKALNNFVSWYVSETNFTSADVYGMYCSYVFDMHAHALYSPIITGGSLCVVPEDIRLDLKALNDYFVEHGCTHTYITSQVGKLFAESGMDTSIGLLCFGGMKLGELNAPDSIGPFESYGPSENLAISTSIFANKRIHPSSIGYFVSNVKGYVLDDECRRVPVGAVGELYLAGYQVSKGYLNRDGETKHSFISNVFDDDEDYGVLYRTGDLVRFLPDGSLGIVGRRDSQVKIRGNRVELGEVESVIRDMDIVEDVTVWTIDNEGNNELVAYVVLSDEMDDVDLLGCVCDFVGERKPDYMVPSYVVELDEVPLTVNGKVDKGALPEVDLDVLSVEYVAPVSETEKLIVDAFELVFDYKGLGLYDDFVRLGGDSIGAIRVVSLLEKDGVSCSAKDILNYKTPYLIAQHIDDNIEITSYGAVEGVVDLLPIQSYFFNQVKLNNFTQHFVLKFNTDVDVGILQKSLDELINLHDMLRAVYRFDGDNVIQEVLPLNSHICDIKEYNIEDNFDENIKNIFVKSTESINVENKLMDVNLVRYNDESYLMLIIHHLIVDGVSWNILLSDLTDIYYRLLKGENLNLVRPYPYKLWVENVKDLVDDISDSEKQYWIDVNSLLDDSSIKGQSNVFVFSVDCEYDVDNLLMLSEEEYLALVISRAYKKTYGEDIIFNRESYGRDETIANLNRTIGWFTSQYPVPVNVNNGYDDVSLMRDVYNIKRAFGDVGNLGLNYASLIYTTGELEFKHCLVTFNFLSTEFVFKNELFESVNHYLSENIDDGGEINIGRLDFESYGVTFNVSRVDGSYVISGDYAEDTYLGDKIDVFFDNIKDELSFIANYKFEDIVCCLSEAQLGVYLDEKVYDKGTAYSVADIFDCGSDYSVDEVKGAIYALIDRHPILKGRVLDNGDLPLLVCDSYPEISVSDVDDYSKLIKPFDLEKSLSRFFIVDNDEGMCVVYDMHHVISDATSRTIINRDLGLALNGKLDDGLDLGFVYASCDSFESQFKPEYDSAHGFFREMFVDIDEVSSFLNDVDGVVGSVGLPIRGVREDVLSFVHDRGITVSSFLNAVFAYTYSRFVGGGKVCYNFTENGRHEYYAQDALGMFIRTVPVIVDCSNKSVGDFLSGVYDLVLEAMGSSVYPFRLLASEFGLSNSVSFEYNYDLNDTSGVGDEIIFSDEADCVSDLLCVVNDLEDGFLVSLNHSDNFSQDSAERFVKVFRDVLVQFLDNEELCDIDYISNDDVLLLDSYNDTEYDLDYVDVLEAFNDNLSKFPDDMLVSYGDCSYTYSEGAFVAGKIASCLKDLGVEEQDKIAFLVERSELYMFCVLGILSCGAVYVPLDDKLPDERISFILDDTSTNVLIVSDETYNRVVDLVNDDDVVILNISDIVNGDIGTLSKLSVGYGDLACILYTSGTTGVPKGVKVTRKSLINVCENYIENYSLDSNDVYGLFSAIGFDMATMVINLVICAGGCLAVVPDNVKLDILKLNDYIVACDVSHVAMPTPVGKLFMESIDETSLDVLLVGGEMLGDFVCSGTYRVVDGYGPTESFAFICSIDKSEKIDYSSIGFINSNVKVYVLDNEMRRVPMGAVGELYISGYQLADGYLNRDEETDYAFVDNSYEDNDGFNRLYRTGDMVRFLPDGSLGIVGRRDSQVKIRGNRVELGEVESVIRNIDFVENVTVQTIRNDGVEELVAYVVVSGDEFEGNLRELVCDYINTRKPDYMVPSYVVMLNEIPLTVNGKVDRGALPDVDVDSLSVEYVAPRSETEKAIVDAFEKVLNCENIGVYDDFVRLGGDSLSAIKLLTYLDGFNISVGDVLSLRTPSAISNSIGNISFDLDVYSLDSGCPLNEPQLNVYLDIKTNDKKDAYLIPLVLNISDEYSVEDIKSALAVMFDVHPVLGMCVSDDFDVPYLIKGQIPSIMVESDVNNDFIAEFLTKPFDLYDSLCRFLIVEAKDSFILYSVFHHIIFDAISEEVFKRNLYSILDGGVVGVDDSFLKVSAFSQQISESNDYAEAEEFYDSMLVDVDEASDLLDCILADGPGSTSIGLDIDNELLNSFLERHNLSLNVFFSSVFAYTLSRFVGSEKILFNIVENGRDRYGNYNSIGMFVNTLPLLVDCKNQEIASFVEYVSRVVYGVMRYNYYPFRLLANNYDIKSDILFQFLPGWVMDTNIPDMVGDVEYDDLLNDMGGLNADFSVKIIQGGNDYLLSVVYSDKYSRDFIDRFVKSYKLILNDMLNVGKLGDISYVSCDDLTLLDKFNETEMDLDYEDVLDAFNANLVNCLDNVLVSYMDRSYSYGEGAFIADKIAKSLTNFGLKSGDCVGFLVPRSELYMFSVLGILSCGGVFVPLDDDLPDERLSIILEDSDCKIVIVSNDTNERLSNLEYGGVVLNISNIVNCDNGSLSYLPVTYGDCACILYTSGSTGVPKGVKVTRKALVNVATFYVDTYGLSSDDVYGLY
ncbi:D-alanine--poly(phosphoribitol) ligase subunit DltA, partial [Methanobrevibacter sp.]